MTWSDLHIHHMWRVHSGYVQSEDGTQVLSDSRAGALNPCCPDARGLAWSPEHMVMGHP